MSSLTPLVALAAVVTASAATLAGELEFGPVVIHAEIKDGSAGLAVGDGFFVSVTDEDNTLRLLSLKDGAFVKELLQLDEKLETEFKKNKVDRRECDLEGCAQIGGRIFWIGSHGRGGQDDKHPHGEVRKDRRVLFATRLSGTGKKVELASDGQPCRALLEAMCKVPGAGKKLEAASRLAAQEKDGLNIEALCADGKTLLIGFRNPVFAEGALFLRLKNPEAVIDSGAAPDVEGPIFVDLGGRGLRDALQIDAERFLLIGGDYQDRTAPGAKSSALYLWDGGAAKPVMLGEVSKAWNPEGLVKDSNGDIYLLSDDDTVDGKTAFRSVRVMLKDPK